MHMFVKKLASKGKDFACTVDKVLKLSLINCKMYVRGLDSSVCDQYQCILYLLGAKSALLIWIFEGPN